MLRKEGEANQHLSTIERQVDLAARILNDAAAELCRLRTQPTEAESLDFTNSETAAVIARGLHQELRLPVPHAAELGCTETKPLRCVPSSALTGTAGV